MFKKFFIIVLVFCFCLLPLTSLAVYADTVVTYQEVTDTFFFPVFSNYNISSDSKIYVPALFNYSFNYGDGYLSFLSGTSLIRYLPSTTFDGTERYDDNNITATYYPYFYDPINHVYSQSFDYTSYSTFYMIFGSFVQSGNWQYYMPVLVFNEYHLNTPFKYLTVGVTDSPADYNSLTAQEIPMGGIAPPYSSYYKWLNIVYWSPTPSGIRSYISFNISVPLDFSYSERSYVLNSDTEDYDLGYLNGYDNGYSSIENKSFSDGYNSGYDSGFAVGRSAGYNEALEVGANQNTFIGFITAALDVPLRTFSALTDFDFLGINLKQFFLSLLTVGLLVFVIKLLFR